MNKFLLPFIFIACHVPSLYAQSPAQLNGSEILQGLKKLNHVGSVLYIAAHPDDENTRLLPYLSSEKKVRTGYLSITRGDGGQNLIGKEQGDALGLIRTHELLAARRIDGGEQFFTRANDFGFSKNPEETFTFWNKDSILADMVWVIRNFKPDVIITRFPTTGEGGHGHHTASAILALEAFDAAADPKRFPQQLAYTQVWQTRRLFWNTFNFGTTNTTSPNQLKIDVGLYNPLVGKSYGELAGENRSMHKSQGFGTAKTRGPVLEYFKLLKGDSAKTDLFDGIELSWKRYNATTKIGKQLDAIIKKYNPAEPESILPDLILVYKELQSLDEKDSNLRYWKKLKLKEAESLLLSCAGLWLDAYVSEYSSVPGNPIEITSQLIKRNNSNVVLTKISYGTQSDSVTSLPLKTNELITIKRREILHSTNSFSNPYWLNEKHGAGAFTIRDPLLIGKPENDPAMKITFTLQFGDLVLPIERALVYKYTDPVKGELHRPFEILPPATINISEKILAFVEPVDKVVQLIVKANSPNISGTIQVTVPEGWNLTLKKNDFSLVNKGDEAVLEAIVSPGKNSTSGKLSASVTIQEKAYTKSIQRIEYDHIPYQFILTDAEVGLVFLDLKKAGTNIGYIPGAGDEIPACLKQIGYTVTELTDDLLTNGNLSNYSAIITGIRAYNTVDRLQVHYAKLMEYVNKGGNLIVQYNTNTRIGPIIAKIGPYPFTISRDRVTDENAEVRILKPSHPAFNYPNIISSKDFEGWVQERGIYFASDIDKKYETLLSMNDPTEKPNEGSLILANYGKGNFVYTGLVFFRELPAGVPGAYRLLTNLLSLPSQK